MKQINKYIVERLHINKDIGNHSYNYHPKTRDELKELVDKLINERGNDADLNDIDTSAITDMNYMFYKSKFNGDISNWNVSNVESMDTMFYKSLFTDENGDISNWDVSNVKDMSYMFSNSSFTGENGDISNWDVSNVINMEGIFYDSPLEKNPPKWYKN